MQENNPNNTQNGGGTAQFEVQPRVYVRKLGADYTEIVGIKSFERNDHDTAGGEISFVMADGQEAALNKLLLSSSDKYVDVKMEFSVGMLMIMKFSGFVEHIFSDSISFGVSTPITTDVVENIDTLQ